MIGAFVVFAVTIMVASLIVFGSGKFFKKTNKYVMYFNESVKGLTVGSPVLFKGVQIGSVTSIAIHADLAKLEPRIPIVIEVEPERFHVSAKQENLRHPGKVAAALVERGLRAVLATQSLITGQLAIELDFYADTKVCYAPPQVDEDYKDYLVIPTCDSAIQRLISTLEKLDIDKLVKKVDSILAGLDKFVNDPELTASVKALKETLQDVGKLVNRVDRQVDPLAKDLKHTVKGFGKLATDLDPRLKELSANLEKTLSSFDKTLSGVRGVISADSPLIVQLENSLQEISGMSKSLRQLANLLDQQPESLIRGKGKPKGK